MASQHRTLSPGARPEVELLNILKLVGELLLLPGSSLLMQGKVPQGGVHAILGVLAWRLLGRISGPVGWVLLAANSFAKSTSGKYLHDYLIDPFRERSEPDDAPAEKPVVEKKPATKPLPSDRDDLTRLEGIGPKISELLQDRDIATFTQLAETDVDRLRQILHEANLRMADPSTWPEQAKLAAAGQWEALDALQEQLIAGRRE